MQTPRRNIELKATDPDPFASLDVCRRLGAEDRGTIEQRDTYFEVARGGLKLREEQPGRPHLIQLAVPRGSGRPKAAPTSAAVLCPQAVCPSRRLSQCSAIS